jgi:hypothetical protein
VLAHPQGPCPLEQVARNLFWAMLAWISGCPSSIIVRQPTFPWIGPYCGSDPTAVDTVSIPTKRCFISSVRPLLLQPMLIRTSLTSGANAARLLEQYSLEHHSPRTHYELWPFPTSS